MNRKRDSLVPIAEALAEPFRWRRNAVDSCGVIFSTCWTGFPIPATPLLTTSGRISRAGKTRPTATVTYLSPSGTGGP